MIRPRLQMCCGLLVALTALVATAQKTPGSFDRDVEALTTFPHRLAGSQANADAVDYLRKELKHAGVDRVFTLDTPVWLMDPGDTPARMTVGDQTVPLELMRPNVIAPPVTPPQGLTGPLIYLGTGDDPGAYRQDLRGAVAVLDYAAPADAWHHAFERGAAAVVFRGTDDDATPYLKHASVPVNLPRFYAPATNPGPLTRRVDLTNNHPHATLHASARWLPRHAPSLFAVIPGQANPTNPDDSGVIVLAAALDTLGSVPHRSPGARRAANAALLLHAARAWANDPPNQTVVLAFFNAQSVGLEGARHFYDTLRYPDREHTEQAQRHLEEAEHFENLRTILQGWAQDPSQPLTDDALRRLLQRQAAAAAADLALTRRNLRLALSKPETPEPDSAQQLETLNAQAAQWDHLRRALHSDDDTSLAALLENAEGDVLDQVVDELIRLAETNVHHSASVLAHTLRLDEQQAQLRSALQQAAGTPTTAVRLHVDLELSGDTPLWGVKLGNDTDGFSQAREVRPSGDSPGYYSAVLAHLRSALAEAKATATARTGLDPRTLRDPWGGRQLVTASIPAAGTVAGHHGFHHLTLTNLHDARPREGHPADTADRLDLPALFTQGRAALQLVEASINRPGLPKRSNFKSHATRFTPRWTPRGSDGPVVQRWVVGGLSEDRPAAGVMVAVWPTPDGDLGRNNAWAIHAESGLPFYEPARLLHTNAHGRYALPALHDALDQFYLSLAADFDDRGNVSAVATWDTIIQSTAASPRTDLLPATGDTVVFRPHENNDQQPLTVLLPGRDTKPRNNGSLRGNLTPFNFVYLPTTLDPAAAPVFQIGGPVRLFLDQDDRDTPGSPNRPQPAHHADTLARSASDLWQLDEQRLDQLRRRAIIRQDLEGLHRRASTALQTDADPEDGANPSEASDPATTTNPRTSYALSRRVYSPLRGTMNDLVAGIVVLLGLTIPFAFALERLVVGASGIRGRVAGFTGFFIATFAVLYLTHPGFAIATAPVLIFLAFAILLLSVLVIVLLMRKFRVELAAIHGQSNASHQHDTSHAATLLAAIQIGISTMRRRRTRTALTLLTVTVLTFTVVCFAGFEPRLAVRTTPLGPTPDTAPPDALLVRSIAYQPLPPALSDLARETLPGPDTRSEPTVWWAGTALPLARADGQADTQLRAVLGLTPLTAQRWPALAQALGQDAENVAAALAGDGLFLPPRLARRLDLQPGDTIRIEGRPATLAGTFDPDALTRLRHLDNRPVLPVDFLDAASALIASDSAATAELTTQEFQYLSATQTVVAGADFARKLGGETSTLTVFPGNAENTDRLADDLARVSPTPVWAAGATGLERRLLTTTAAIDAGPSLLVPLVLGGLIVFGTLLGSITDRREEIATFSALGLGPAHVGALFVAEAAVYAVVGGMGGQLLAQIVAAGAHALSEQGIGRPLPINYASSNALLAITAVGTTVMISALYPAWRAARSANPGVDRAWKPPKPQDNTLDARLPFTLSAYDMTGVMAFLAEHLAAHDDAGLGRFATQHVALEPGEDGRPQLSAEVALAPFDLGVTQRFTLAPAPTDLPGVDEVAVVATRTSGSTGDWARTNRVFLRDLRRQFLLWRTLSPQAIQHYRDEALKAMHTNPPAASTANAT